MATKHKPQVGTVVPLKRESTANVMPEPFWKARGKYGVMRTVDGADLVALADLVQWLAERDGLTIQQAVTRVLDALQPTDLDLLHYTQFENLASDDRAVSDWVFQDAFVGVDRELSESVMRSSPWDEFAPDIPRRFMESARRGESLPGLDEWRAMPEAARRLDLLKDRVRAEILFDLVHPKKADEVVARSFVSIVTSRAHELFGWGSVAAEACDAASAPARVLVKDQKPEWGGKQIHERIAELKSQGRRAPVAAVVAEVGLSDREVRRRRSEYVNSAASPIGNVSATLQGRRQGGA